ncbi:MAG: phosphatidylserine/phosphatidylglycerophosphate/cardiolipin synthase family protein [Deltaproteobacteria bacterium]|nr:phosphatidylserine/phosphatidylglycerophosphate/cardiolipin synthase family protein [Deltaproteobacteria bacterium]
MVRLAHRSAAATGTVLIALIAACATPILKQSLVGTPRVASTRRAFDSLAPTATTSGVSLILDNAESWAARWELLADAERSIDASYFIVEDDTFGAAFLAHLYAKALQGVHVRLLLDGRGSASLTLPLFGRDLLQELAATGNVEVYVFNPPMPQLLRSVWERSFLPMSSGTHQKTLVVDEQLALTGGRNLSRAYFGATPEEPAAMVDADVLLDGPAVLEVRASMERELNSDTVVRIWPDVVNISSQRDELLMLYAAMDAWVRGAVPAEPTEQALAALGAKALAALASSPLPAEREHVRDHLRELVRAQGVWGKAPLAPQTRHQAEVKVVASASRADELDDAATDAFVRALGGAREHAVLVSPYFVITPRLLRAFEQASRRGVAITLLTNSPVSSDNPPAEALFFDTWPEIEARVPTLRIFAKRTRHLLHRKLATFDDGLSFAGTFNLDPFSMHMNSETIVAVWSPAFNRQLRDEVDRLLAGGEFVEYRIVRDARGKARRYPARHPKAGRPVVAYGPRDHVAPKDIEALEAMRELMLSIRGAWDFQVVTD